MKRLKLLLIGVLFFGVLGVGYITLVRGGAKVVVPTATPVAQVSESASLVIDFGDKRIEGSVELAEGENVFSLLQKVAGENDLEMETKQYDFGVFVQSIDGYESSADMAWIYYVNGESGSVAADQHELTNGDMVEWKYIEPEF